MTNKPNINIHDCEILAPRLAPSLAQLSDVLKAEPMAAYAPEVVAFLQALSAYLLKDLQCRSHPELVALGFWLRKANITSFIRQDTNEHNKAASLTKALGLVVHFTPSNVDTMFVYSWVCSLLMGNVNIVRVASANSELRDCLLASINNILSRAEFNAVCARNCFVQYDKSSTVSARLSTLADARVIWGGDESVKAIRSLPTKPRCRDISFADRYSAALINGDELRSADQVHKLASLLWKDTQPYEQQACSSPRVIFWLGEHSKQQALLENIEQLASATAGAIGKVNDHLVTSQLIQSRGMATELMMNRAICVLRVNKLEAEYLEWHSGSGMYLLVQVASLEALPQHCSDKLQTLSYWGLTSEQMLKLASDPSIKGIDRIVPVGQALDFSPNWDGYELFSQLSVKVTIK